MWQKNVRYLDYNASAGITPGVREKLTALLGNEELLVANPSSRHRPGQKVQHLIHEASRKVAQTLGPDVRSDELIWVASGTEANQSVIRSLSRSSPTLIIGAGEHSASHDLIPELRQSLVVELPMLREGTYDLVRLEELLRESRERGESEVGVSLFWANNETGVVLDTRRLKDLISRSGVRVRLHLDGAQVWGKMPLNVPDGPADYVTFSAHKIGAPAGTGLIWKRSNAPWCPLLPGAQNRGQRAGTENVLGILSTGFACEELDPAGFCEETRHLQQHLERGLVELDPTIEIWGWQERRLTNTTRFSLRGYLGYENWVELLDLKGFAVSHGSACQSRTVAPSRVLLAMGASRESALNAIRVSFGPENTIEEVDGFLIALREIIERKKGGST